jgi:hypothetical protein
MLEAWFCFFLLLSISCSNNEQNQEPLFLADKCNTHGVETYVRCADKKEQISILGDGSFQLVKDGKIILAWEFCKEEQAEFKLRVCGTDRSYFKFNGVKKNITIIKKPWQRADLWGTSFKRIEKLTEWKDLMIEYKKT